MGSKAWTDLKVWQAAHEVNVSVYRLTGRFPRREPYGMAAQMRRASWSIPTNIVEGFGRRLTRDQAHFYAIAMGATEELKYGLLAARDLGYLSDFGALWPKLESISRVLRSMTDAVLSGDSAPMPEA